PSGKEDKPVSPPVGSPGRVGRPPVASADTAGTTGSVLVPPTRLVSGAVRPPDNPGTPLSPVKAGMPCAPARPAMRTTTPRHSTLDTVRLSFVRIALPP